MYVYSNLTGKIYINVVELIQDDRLDNWKEYQNWKLNGGQLEIVEATNQELILLSQPIVPQSISRMKLKLELFERGISVDEIIETIQTIPSAIFSEAEKQKALIKFQEATSYDRYNADLNLIATLMGLSQQDLDEIFINGNIF